MTVMGEGRDPGPDHLRQLARKHALRNGEAILAEVQDAIGKWADHADAAGLPKKAAKLVGDRIVPQVLKTVAAPKKPPEKATSSKGKAPGKAKPATKAPTKKPTRPHKRT